MKTINLLPSNKIIKFLPFIFSFREKTFKISNTSHKIFFLICEFLIQKKFLKPFLILMIKYDKKYKIN